MSDDGAINGRSVCNNTLLKSPRSCCAPSSRRYDHRMLTMTFLQWTQPYMLILTLCLYPSSLLTSILACPLQFCPHCTVRHPILASWRYTSFERQRYHIQRIQMLVLIPAPSMLITKLQSFIADAPLSLSSCCSSFPGPDAGE